MFRPGVIPQNDTSDCPDVHPMPRRIQFLLIPGTGHGAAETLYGSRRRLKFVGRHLCNLAPSVDLCLGRATCMTDADVRRIAVWSGPRNLSTALMRSFSSRSDCVVSDEPFYASYLAHHSVDHPGREEVIASQPTDWREVAQRLTVAPPPLDRPVWYQKHMAHHMRPEMLGEWLDRLDHALLIRHPGFVIQSYRRVVGDMELAECGLPWQWRLFQHLQSTRGLTPAVIDAGQLRRNPEQTLRALCAALGLAWEPAMLRWSAGPHPQDGVWAKHWYANTWNSTGFAPPSEADPEPPRLAVPYFDEALDLYHRLSEHCLPMAV